MVEWSLTWTPPIFTPYPWLTARLSPLEVERSSGSVWVGNGSTFTVNDGEITSSSSFATVVSTGDGKLVLKGGTITNTGGGAAL